jgi:hypothetical protein
LSSSGGSEKEDEERVDDEHHHHHAVTYMASSCVIHVSPPILERPYPIITEYKYFKP